MTDRDIALALHALIVKLCQEPGNRNMIWRRADELKAQLSTSYERGECTCVRGSAGCPVHDPR